MKIFQKQKQLIKIGDFTLEWSFWYNWNLIKVDARTKAGIHIPNRQSGVYEVRIKGAKKRLTIGKASNLRHRVRQALVKGKAKHTSGDRIRRHEDVRTLQVRWAETVRPCAAEEELHKLHESKFGKLPKHVKRT